MMDRYSCQSSDRRGRKTVVDVGERLLVVVVAAVVVVVLVVVEEEPSMIDFDWNGKNLGLTDVIHS